MSRTILLLGGAASVPVADALEDLGARVLAIANTGNDQGGRRPDVEALRRGRRTVIPVTDEPNPTTVAVTGLGEVPAGQWVRSGRPGKLLAVRMRGRPGVHPDVAAALAVADATVLGPDDPDLVVDPILKVLAQNGLRLPTPLVAAGHHHHRFDGLADDTVEGRDLPPAALAAAVLDAIDHPRGHHHHHD